MSAVNYAELPEIKAAITRIQSMQGEGENIAGWFLYPVGKQLELTVEVTDPEVTRVILGSSFGQNSLMPGMKITNIRFGDLERKDVLKAWLRAQLEQMERHP